MAAKNWMAAESKREKRAGTKGALTEKAHRAGFKKATPFARHVRAHPENYSTSTKRQSNMALAYAKARG